MVSLWYAMDEDYFFSMIHNFYMCGIDVQPLANLTVRDVGRKRMSRAWESL